MKAIRIHRFGGPEVLKLEEIPAPVAGAGEVLVRISAAGVNPVDGYLRSGTYRFQPTLPYTPGSDAAGLVVAAGAGVLRIKVGDRVYIGGSLTGTYAEMALCRESQANPLPPGVSFSAGAALHVPYATAYYGLFRRAVAVAGETVLVHGASGGVGIAAVQLARAAGLRVIGTAGSAEGRAAVSAAGAHQVFDHREEGYLQQLVERNEGTRPDIILEMLANANLAKDLRVLAPHGRVVVIGSRGTVEIDPRDTMSQNSSILGMSLMNVGEEELRGIHAALGAGLENGTLRPIIREELPLADAARAHELVMQPAARGKIVLIP
jgi:NADPH2:quinone reductase